MVEGPCSEDEEERCRLKSLETGWGAMDGEIRKLFEALDPRRRSPDLYLAAEKVLVEAERTEEALDLLSMGLEEFPDDPGLLSAYGDRLWGTKEMESALDPLSSAAERIQPYMIVFERLARLLKKQGKAREAVLAYRVHLAYEAYLHGGQEAPDDADRTPFQGIQTETMAELCVEQGQLLEAERIYEHLAQNSPGESRYSTRLEEIRTLRERELEENKNLLGAMTKLLEEIEER